MYWVWRWELEWLRSFPKWTHYSSLAPCWRCVSQVRWVYLSLSVERGERQRDMFPPKRRAGISPPNRANDVRKCRLPRVEGSGLERERGRASRSINSRTGTRHVVPTAMLVYPECRWNGKKRNRILNLSV